jgi:excisionase family DNA binding protein
MILPTANEGLFGSNPKEQNHQKYYKMEEILKELQELKNLAVLGTKQALTMNDCALFTGLSKSHIYKLVCGKNIPHYKSGGKLTYFDKEEITKWMLKRRIKTAEELETEAATYVATGKRGGKNG